MRAALALILVVSSAWAGEPQFSVVAQRDLSTGLEQVALVFEGSRVRLTRNSNFLDRPGPRAEIGLFTSPLTDSLKAQLESMRHLRARLDRVPPKGAGLAPPGDSPHRVRWLLDGRELPTGFQYQPEVQALLERAMSLADWKPVSAMRAEVDSAGKTRVTPLGEGAGEAPGLRCERRDDSSLRCEVPAFGSVYLKRPARP